MHADHLYHASRERKCRELAEQATDPDVRRRHLELAELHAQRAVPGAVANNSIGPEMQGLGA